MNLKEPYLWLPSEPDTIFMAIYSEYIGSLKDIRIDRIIDSEGIYIYKGS